MPQEEYEVLAARLSHQRNADVFIYNGTIESNNVQTLVNSVPEASVRRENAILVLATFGGDAHAAYRIAQCLLHRYKKLCVMLGGPCKSAGTLLVLGAHEIVMSDEAELGPLDVQIKKVDEIGEVSSGLTPAQALMFLHGRAIQMFQVHFMDLRFKMGFTTRAAADVASRMATSLLEPIFGQIDPMRLGETERLVQIAFHYGLRLSEKAKNLHDGALADLIAGYPDHGFIIDLDEAKKLFKSVREPNALEESFLSAIHFVCRSPIDNREPPVILCLSEEPDEPQDDHANANVVNPASGSGAAGDGGQIDPARPADGGSDHSPESPGGA